MDFEGSKLTDESITAALKIFQYKNHFPLLFFYGDSSSLSSYAEIAFIWGIFQNVCLATESCYKVKLRETNNDFSLCKGG